MPIPEPERLRPQRASSGVIGSRYQFASGNWKDYKLQSAFDIEEDKKLGALVLPPELGAAVHVFRRKTPIDGS